MGKWKANMDEFEKALALLETEELRERGRSWLRYLLARNDYWQMGGLVHLHGHWARVLVHALSIAGHEGLPEADLDALCAAAVFHDTRRKNPMFDIGHGARGAAHYKQACEQDGLPFDERAFLAIAWHDRNDTDGEQAIRDWAHTHRHDANWTERALVLYRIFKDADGLDRVRLDDGGLDERYLRLPFSKSRVTFAWELLETLPYSRYERRENRGTNPLSAATSAPVNRLYIQSLDQPLPRQDTEDPELFEGKITMLAKLLHDADSVVVGIGSGLSTAAGYDFYHESDLFDYAFEEFWRAHGFATLFDGMYHLFSTNEEQWAFNAAVADFAESLPVGAPYRQLAELLAKKDHFVITTNVDGQVPRAFQEGRYWLFQGDMRYLQCSQPCHDEVIYDPSDTMRLLSRAQVGDDGIPRLPANELPRCPECGRLMAPWVRDTNFVEGTLWQEQKAEYESFVGHHLAHDGSVLFLELGVSSMTPAIIKLPFWDMAARNPNAFYVSVNCADSTVPEHLGVRGMVVTADLGRVLSALAEHGQR